MVLFTLRHVSAPILGNGHITSCRLVTRPHVFKNLIKWYTYPPELLRHSYSANVTYKCSSETHAERGVQVGTLARFNK